MSSPVTGDISNSDRDPNDLPVFAHTWTMYGINIRRSQAEALHNVGHQMEAIHNTRVVQTDIEDWTPANTGAKTGVSRSTWFGLTYPWPGVPLFGQREESQWYTYWFQNFPGRGNRSPHGANWMTNC